MKNNSPTEDLISNAKKVQRKIIDPVEEKRMNLGTIGKHFGAVENWPVAITTLIATSCGISLIVISFYGVTEDELKFSAQVLLPLFTGSMAYLFGERRSR